MPPDTYDPLAKTLHWTMAALIVGLFAVGLVMEDLPKGDVRNQVFGLHKAFGVVVLALQIVRLGWRLGRGAPALPATMSATEQWLAMAAHGSLYGLMVLLPLSGIVMSQSGGRDVAVLGWALPALVGKDESLHHLMEDAHGALAWLLAAIVAAHLVAALRHHFMLNDDVLQRMLPRRGN